MGRDLEIDFINGLFLSAHCWQQYHCQWV